MGSFSSNTSNNFRAVQCDSYTTPTLLRGHPFSWPLLFALRTLYGRRYQRWSSSVNVRRLPAHPLVAYSGQQYETKVCLSEWNFTLRTPAFSRDWWKCLSRFRGDMGFPVDVRKNQLISVELAQGSRTAFKTKLGIATNRLDASDLGSPINVLPRMETMVCSTLIIPSSRFMSFLRSPRIHFPESTANGDTVYWIIPVILHRLKKLLHLTHCECFRRFSVGLWGNNWVGGIANKHLPLNGLV